MSMRIEDSLQVGVVIPVFNRAQTLIETLPFVLCQSLRPTRLVIADDGSTDGTGDAVEAWLRERASTLDWEVLRLKHRNAASARNAGFQRVSHLPYISFLDSDDHWPEDFLLRSCRALAARPDAVAASAPRKYVAVDPREGNQCAGGDALADRPVEWLFRNGGGIASCTVLRTESFQRSSRWNTSVGSSEDTLLFCEIATLGPWLACPGDPVTFHLGSALSRGEAGNLSRYDACLIKWARRHEMIYDRLPPNLPQVDQSVLRQSIANRWYRVARQQQRRGNRRFARSCLKRCLHWTPRSLRMWRKLLRAYLPSSKASSHPTVRAQSTRSVS